MEGGVLVAQGLRKVYVGREGPLVAVEDATFGVRANEFVAIIGPSGCGKSTLLRMMAGLVEPTAGALLLDGQPLCTPQRRIGMVFQHANLMPWRTALANVMLPLEIEGLPRRVAEERARAALDRVGLSSFAATLPRDLSGGMRQRVSLARALVHDPDILLLDEPFGALDALTRERMGNELLRIWQQDRKTVIMVTHDIQEAVLLADRVLTMSPAPGRLESEMLIDIPRPRTAHNVYEPRFIELVHTLRDTLGGASHPH